MTLTLFSPLSVLVSLSSTLELQSAKAAGEVAKSIPNEPLSITATTTYTIAIISIFSISIPITIIISITTIAITIITTIATTVMTNNTTAFCRTTSAVTMTATIPLFVIIALTSTIIINKFFGHYSHYHCLYYSCYCCYSYHHFVVGVGVEWSWVSMSH